MTRLVPKKYQLTIILAFLTIDLVGLLVYLWIRNYKSDVYIDTEASRIEFINSESENFNQFFSSIVIDSVHIYNCDLDFKHFEIADFYSEKILEIPRGELTIKNSDVVVSAPQSLIFKDFKVPQDSKIGMTLREGYLLVEVTPKESNNDYIRGKINISNNQNFVISGPNMKFVPSHQVFTGLGSLGVKLSKTVNDIIFTSNPRFTAKLYLSADKNETLLENTFVSQVSFLSLDLSRQLHNLESTIQKANIQQTGISLIKKRFLLKEQSLDEGEFLILDPGDKYYINRIGLNPDGLIINIIGEKVNGLKSGKRHSLALSITPSILDFVLAEPSKETMWTVLIFVIAQYLLFRNPLTNLLKMKDEKNHTSKVKKKYNHQQYRMHKNLMKLLLLLILFQTGSAQAQILLENGVVKIEYDNNNKNKGYGTGIVFLKTPDQKLYVLTALHVVYDGNFKHKGLKVNFQHDSRAFDAEIYEKYVDFDIAVLELTSFPSNVPLMLLGSCEDRKQMEMISMIGYPEEAFSTSVGNIKDITGNKIILDNIVPSEGNSGGPIILEKSKEVIGVVLQKANANSEEQYALKIDLVKDLFLNHNVLKESRISSENNLSKSGSNYSQMFYLDFR